MAEGDSLGATLGSVLTEGESLGAPEGADEVLGASVGHWVVQLGFVDMDGAADAEGLSEGSELGRELLVGCVEGWKLG